MTLRPPAMAVTGFSLRTPLGDDIDTIVRRMIAGERVIAPNARFDARTYPCQLAATLATDPKPSKHRKFVKRMGLFGMEVGAEALAHSSVPIRGTRLGLFCGYGGLRAHWDDLMPVLEHQDGTSSASGAWSKGFSSLHPFWMLFHLSNNAHALLSIQIGAKGDGTTTAGSNAGAQALRAAIAALAVGSIDTALVFAYDSLVEPETILSLGMSQTATQSQNPADVAAPYDEHAAGFVPSEAAAAIVLQRPEDAKTRSLGLVSAAVSADGHTHLPDASTLARTLSTIAEDEMLVDGAGVANLERDQAERTAISEIVNPDALLFSTASSLGQVGAATSIVQTILLTHFLSRRIAPPVAGLSRPASGPLKPLLHPTTIDARSAVALTSAMPGLTGAIRVQLP